MRWTVHGERSLYLNRWVNLWLFDVSQPDGHRIEYHVVRLRSVAAAVVTNRDREVLLLWRHRFITDTWGWELPMGLIEDGETPAQAAAREVEEETGYRPLSLRPLAYSQPANGITDSEHHLFWTDEATWTGPPVEVNESDRVEWVPLDDVPAMVDRREIVSGPTMVGLLRVLLGPLRTEPAAPQALPHA